jgi:hypothetical protein
MKPSSSTIIAQLQDQNARLFLELQQVKRVANDLWRENDDLRSVIEAQKIVSGLALTQGGQHE